LSLVNLLNEDSEDQSGQIQGVVIAIVTDNRDGKGKSKLPLAR
jgi:hypothetical protein